MTRRSAFFKVIVAAVLLGALIFFSNSGPVRGIKSGLGWMMRPFFHTATSLSWLIGKGISQEAAIKLIQENQSLKSTLAELERLRQDTEFLRRALGLKEESKVPTKAARVLLYSKELGREFLIIDQGEKDGIREGELVLDEERLLVGVVRVVNNEFSKVEVASNRTETFEGELLPLSIRVLVRGLGARALAVSLIPSDAPLRRGDLVSVFTQNGPPLVLIGEIVSERQASNTTFKEARALFLARPELLRQVLVVDMAR